MGLVWRYHGRFCKERDAGIAFDVRWHVSGDGSENHNIRCGIGGGIGRESDWRNGRHHAKPRRDMDSVRGVGRWWTGWLRYRVRCRHFMQRRFGRRRWRAFRADGADAVVRSRGDILHLRHRAIHCWRGWRCRRTNLSYVRLDHMAGEWRWCWRSWHGSGHCSRRRRWIDRIVWWCRERRHAWHWRVSWSGSGRCGNRSCGRIGTSRRRRWV